MTAAQTTTGSQSRAPRGVACDAAQKPVPALPARASYRAGRIVFVVNQQESAPKPASAHDRVARTARGKGTRCKSGTVPPL